MGEKYTHTSRSEYKHFSSHSCRSSASSKADNMGVDLDNILKMGCWSRQLTFWEFYSKEFVFINFVTLIQQEDTSSSGNSPISFSGIFHCTNRSSFLRSTEAAIQ